MPRPASWPSARWEYRSCLWQAVQIDAVSIGASVEGVATGTNGWPQHGIDLGWWSGKTVFDRLQSMLDHTVVGAHTASMHERNDRGVEGIEHDGQTVSDQHTQRH